MRRDTGTSAWGDVPGRGCVSIHHAQARKAPAATPAIAVVQWAPVNCGCGLGFDIALPKANAKTRTPPISMSAYKEIVPQKTSCVARSRRFAGSSPNVRLIERATGSPHSGQSAFGAVALMSYPQLVQSVFISVPHSGQDPKLGALVRS